MKQPFISVKIDSDCRADTASLRWEAQLPRTANATKLAGLLTQLVSAFFFFFFYTLIVLYHQNNQLKTMIEALDLRAGNVLRTDKDYLISKMRL